jgi:hypothetical protein
MLTKNNWLTCNLAERFANPESDFLMEFNPYPFKKMKFDDAVELTIKEITANYSNFYLGLSGGYDSEFILRTFHKFGIAITPIIVRYCNDAETEYAYKACKELGITPVEIFLTDDQFVEYFYEKIFKQLNGIGFHSTHGLFAAEYAANHNGTLLTGGHFIGTYHTNIADDWASTCEWEFYSGYLYPASNKIDFYFYTPELTYSMFPDTVEGGWSYYKHKLLGLEYREKMRPIYSDELVARIRAMLGKREGFNHIFKYDWTREEFDEFFKNSLIKS